MTVLVSAVLLAAGAPATLALAQDILPAGTTAVGTTGAQSAATCPKPRLGGLPKRPKVANAKIPFKLTNLTVGSVYLVKAGGAEVSGGTAQTSTVKASFKLPDRGAKSHKVAITAIVDTVSCANAPWKLKKQIRYKAVQPAPAAPAPSAPAGSGKPASPPVAATPAPRPAKPAKPAKPLTPAKPTAATPAKPAKQPWQTLPKVDTPLNQRTYMTPTDAASRIEQQVAAPRLGRLDRKTDKAKSNHALIGLGIVGVLFIASTIAGLWTFVRRDEIEFEQAMSYQLRHLEEGDFSVLPDEASEPEGPPMPPSEEAPFADPGAVPAEEAPTPPVAVPAEEELVRQRAELEHELQRLLTEAGVEAELQGILADARSEAERQGVALDTDIMLQTLCDELNGAAGLSDLRREQIRTMFATILAEETQLARATPEPHEVSAPAPAS